MGNRQSHNRSNIATLSYKKRSIDSDISSSSQKTILRIASSRTSMVEWPPFPTDIIFVTQNGNGILVVADYTNKVLKVFFSYKVAEVQMDGVPYRMAKVDQNRFAVTLPLTQEIKLVSISALAVVDVIRTEKMYSGITVPQKSKNVLVVGSHRLEPGSVDLLDLSGTVLKSFTHDRFENALFIAPSFLCSTPAGDILVSDYSMHAVTCISLKGDVRWRHQPHRGDNFLEDAVGIACIDNDFIFLVDRLKKTVFRFGSNGWCFGPVIQLRQESCEPFSICSDRQGTIYVGLENGKILVYHDDDGTEYKTVIELPKPERDS